jgi:hypothetical protein
MLQHNRDVQKMKKLTEPFVDTCGCVSLPICPSVRSSGCNLAVLINCLVALASTWGRLNSCKPSLQPGLTETLGAGGYTSCKRLDLGLGMPHLTAADSHPYVNCAVPYAGMSHCRCQQGNLALEVHPAWFGSLG